MATWMHDTADNQKQPHFEPIIRPWTDVSLGQCSYLNMCYGEVRYRHHRKSHRFAHLSSLDQPLFAQNPSLANANQSRSAPAPRPTTSYNSSAQKQCRYIHYRLVPPASAETFAAIEEKERSMIPRLDDETRRRVLGLAGPDERGRTSCQEEAQWLNMDARDMDTAVLGRYVFHFLAILKNQSLIRIARAQLRSHPRRSTMGHSHDGKQFPYPRETER